MGLHSWDVARWGFHQQTKSRKILKKPQPQDTFSVEKETHQQRGPLGARYIPVQQIGYPLAAIDLSHLRHSFHLTRP